MVNHEKTADFDTDCGQCVFLNWDDSDSTNATCSLGRLSKYREQECVEEENSVPIIKNRICIACRPQSWADKFEDKDLVEQVQSEIRISVGLAVPILDEVDLKWFEYGISELLNDDWQCVVVGTLPKFAKRTVELLSRYKCPFQVVSCLEDEPVLERLIDLAANKMKTGYYLAIRPTVDMHQRPTIDDIHNFIVDDIRQVVHIGPYPELVNLPFHRHVGGNDGGYVFDKVRFLEDKQNSTLSYSWDDVRLCTLSRT